MSSVSVLWGAKYPSLCGLGKKTAEQDSRQRFTLIDVELQLPFHSLGLGAGFCERVHDWANGLYSNVYTYRSGVAHDLFQLNVLAFLFNDTIYSFEKRSSSHVNSHNATIVADLPVRESAMSAVCAGAINLQTLDGNLDHSAPPISGSAAGCQPEFVCLAHRPCRASVTVRRCGHHLHTSRGQ